MALVFIKNTLKWSAKLGIAGGTIYIANDAGLFGTADQAESGVKKLEKDYHEGLKEVNEVIIPQYVPKELLDYVPEVPKIDVKEFMPDIDINFTSDIRGLWNKGVLATFSGLANSPETAKLYSNDVIEYVKNQINSTEEDPKK